MERIKNLNAYQKGILLILIAMIVIFGVVYSITSSRVGFLYNDVILVPSEVDGNLLYSGTIKGKKACFTVTADKTVTLRHGEIVYGPYTVKIDPTAIPEEDELSNQMTGIELREGDEILFRGGIFKAGGADSFFWMVNEDGRGANISVMTVMSNGIEYDMNGKLFDPVKPSVRDILHLMEGPKLTNKGEWLAWFSGIFISIITAVSILFADELFRWNLAFQIRNAERAEPSEWEIAGRYIGWTALTIIALALYIMGLQ